MKSLLQVLILTVCVMLTHTTTSANEEVDRALLRTTINQKMEKLGFTELKSINDFINAIPKLEAGKHKEVYMVTVENLEFPFFLEDLYASHQRLRYVPRELKSLVVIENDQVPGVKNVYVRITKDQAPVQDTIYAWVPDLKIWSKYMDFKANKLQDETVKAAFLKLFWIGNKILNPELIAPVESSSNSPLPWQWDRMPHPKSTRPQVMYVPIATFTGAITEYFQ